MKRTESYNHTAMDGGYFQITPSAVPQLLFELICKRVVSVALVPALPANSMSTLFFDVDHLGLYTGQYIIDEIHELVQSMYGDAAKTRCVEKNESKDKYHVIYPRINVKNPTRKLITRAFNVVFGQDPVLDAGCSKLRYPGFIKWKKQTKEEAAHWELKSRYLPYDPRRDVTEPLTLRYLQTWCIFGGQHETQTVKSVNEAVAAYQLRTRIELIGDGPISGASGQNRANNQQCQPAVNVVAGHEANAIAARHDAVAQFTEADKARFDEFMHGLDLVANEKANSDVNCIGDIKAKYAHDALLSNVLAQWQYPDTTHAEIAQAHANERGEIPPHSVVKVIHTEEECDKYLRFGSEHAVIGGQCQLLINKQIHTIKRVGQKAFYFYTTRRQCNCAGRTHTNSEIYYALFLASRTLYQFCRSSHCAQKHAIMYAAPKYSENSSADYLVASMFTKSFPSTFVYNVPDPTSSHGRWYMRQVGKYYSSRHAEKTLRLTIATVFVDTMGLYHNNKRTEIGEDEKALEALNKMVMNFTQRCQNVKSVNMVVQALRDYCTVSNSSLSQKNPDTIVFKEGVFDIGKGLLRGLQPDEFVTDDMLVGMKYEAREDIDEKRWRKLNKFLKRVFPDKATRQSFLEHAAVACTQRQLKRIILNYGGTNNGKSCWNGLFQYMLGQYAKAIEESMIQVGSKADQTSWVKTEGCRYVYVDEINEKKQLNVSTLKKVSGNRVLAGRMIYSTRTTFENFAKCFIYLNSLPLLDSNGAAVQGRVVIIWWSAQFVDPSNPLHPAADSKEHIFKQKAYYGSAEFHKDCAMPLMWRLSDVLKSLGDRKPSISAHSRSQCEQFFYGKSLASRVIAFFDRNYKKITKPGWEDIVIPAINIADKFIESPFFPKDDPKYNNPSTVCSLVKDILQQHLPADRFQVRRKRISTKAARSIKVQYFHSNKRKQEAKDPMVRAPVFGYEYAPQEGQLSSLSQPRPSELHDNGTEYYDSGSDGDEAKDEESEDEYSFGCVYDEDDQFANVTQVPAKKTELEEDVDLNMMENWLDDDYADGVDRQEVDAYYQTFTKENAHDKTPHSMHGARSLATATPSISASTCWNSSEIGDDRSMMAPSTIISAVHHTQRRRRKRRAPRPHAQEIMEALMKEDGSIRNVLKGSDLELLDADDVDDKLMCLATLSPHFAESIERLEAHFGENAAKKQKQDDIGAHDDYDEPTETTNNSACFNN